MAVVPRWIRRFSSWYAYQFSKGLGQAEVDEMVAERWPRASPADMAAAAGQARLGLQVAERFSQLQPGQKIHEALGELQEPPSGLVTINTTVEMIDTDGNRIFRQIRSNHKWSSDVSVYEKKITSVVDEWLKRYPGTLYAGSSIRGAMLHFLGHV